MVWPSVEYEELPWHSSSRGMSRRTARNAPLTYKSAVVPRIADAQVNLDAETTTLLETATLAVKEFDLSHAHCIVPFTPLLLRSESFASSQIEQLTSSARRILEAELTELAGTNARLIVANTRQMEEAASIEGASTSTLLYMHDVLLRDSAPEIAGVLRQQPVWIGGHDFYPRDALFVPPHHSHLPALMEDLEAFVARRDLPILVHAALAHAQFETIHPFADGNGRTGRALVHVLLRQRGLTRETSLPLSAGLLTEIDSYFTALDSYREGRPQEIIDVFIHSAISAVERGTWLAAELNVLRGEWEGEVSARGDALVWQLIPLLLRRPVVTSRIVAEELNTTPVSARKALDALEGTGILASAMLDKRTRAWRAVEVLDLLDEFAARRGRRQAP
ncbi:Fic family protein [Corynebacterium sanguinis]|uniref:Fic family protein n=1 Tax=Corynebacterium sanguinis TaxID=2594913 RepID=UPI00223C28AB|nr:Fic family protein [Corynebacterium sanguinis]MCT1664155.1 Fic family protein [Corynebacterium sanguinis]